MPTQGSWRPLVIISIASPSVASAAGAVYVFTRNAGSFNQTLRIDMADEQIADAFGASLALWSNIALIGASGDGGTGAFANPYEGSAAVYIDGTAAPVGRVFGDGFE